MWWTKHSRGYCLVVYYPGEYLCAQSTWSWFRTQGVLHHLHHHWRVFFSNENKQVQEGRPKLNQICDLEETDQLTTLPYHKRDHNSSICSSLMIQKSANLFLDLQKTFPWTATQISLWNKQIKDILNCEMNKIREMPNGNRYLPLIQQINSPWLVQIFQEHQ